MRRIACASTPVTNVEWLEAVLTAVTQHHRLLLVDSYDAGVPIPSFCIVAPKEGDIKEFLCDTLRPACLLVEQGCFSMYVDNTDLDAPLEGWITPLVTNFFLSDEY